MFSGRGAGGDPTGSAVIGDLIDIARNMRLGGAGNNAIPEDGANLLPVSAVTSRFYLRVNVDDQPSVLGIIATILGHNDVSLAAMEMKVLDPQKLGEIVFMTHPCLEESFRAAVETIEALPIVRKIANWFRVEGQ
jgi:homoserine dehydrogenase